MRKLALLLALAASAVGARAQHLADWVDCLMGVVDDRSNNCVVGPRLPYSSITPSPQTPDGGMDGYRHDEPIIGFGQLHVSGTGWGSYGHFLVSPQTGKMSTSQAEFQSAHSADVCKPYYYATTLDDQRVRVEIAPAHYSAAYRFTAEGDEPLTLLFDASQAIASHIVPGMRGRSLRTEAEVDPEQGVVRMTTWYVGGWPGGVYGVSCVGKVDKKPAEAGVWRGGDARPGEHCLLDTTETREHQGAYLAFGDEREVMLKVAVSFVGCERAEQLLDAEIPGWDFDKVRDDALAAWDAKLAAIEVDTPDDDHKRLFYSSLYRVLTLASDRSLDSPWDDGVPYWDDNYAFWDTFRTAYPLLMLIDRQAVRDNISTLVNRQERNGIVTDGFVAGIDRIGGDQGGNDVDCLLADAYVKGLDGVDWERAYAILQHNADSCRVGYHDSATVGDAYLQYPAQGWMPEGAMTASQTLEFAYNDYCASQVARGLGLAQEAERLAERSRKWEALWNPDLEDQGYKGFIDGRKPTGEFSYFCPSEYGGSWDKIFYEATSWTYSYYAPHQIDRLIELMGGPEAFVDRLSYGFEHGLVSYTNEPGFLCAPLFTDAGRPNLSSKWMHCVMDNGYDLAGFPENDDTGSMASWYVFSATGLFPNAGQDYYYVIAPRHERSAYSLGDGKTLEILSNAAPGRYVVKEVRLNGKPHPGHTIRHSEIADGGTLEIILEE